VPDSGKLLTRQHHIFNKTDTCWHIIIIFLTKLTKHVPPPFFLGCPLFNPFFLPLFFFLFPSFFFSFLCFVYSLVGSRVFANSFLVGWQWQGPARVFVCQGPARVFVCHFKQRKYSIHLNMSTRLGIYHHSDFYNVLTFYTFSATSLSHTFICGAKPTGAS